MRITIWIGGLAGTLLRAGAAGAQNCSPPGAMFTCTLGSGVTTCSVAAGTNEFITLDLLSAALGCDSTMTEDTPLLVAAGGGAGGRGSPAQTDAAGLGGVAIMVTTIAALNDAYGATTAYCYGIGGQGGTSGAGTGGASSILRTCVNESQTATTGVLLIAGGGGGGGIDGGEAGGGGGLAVSGTSGACPPSCVSGSTANGAGTDATDPGFGGGGGNAGVGGEGGGDGGGEGGTGVGGVGGAASVVGSGFVGGQSGVTGSSGEGGDSQGGGGGSGGGYGGGGGGGNGAGGGGGGSFAAQSSAPFTYDPGSEPSADGWLTFVFNDSNIPAFTPAGEIGGSTGPLGDSCFPAQTLTVLAIGDYTLLWQDDGNLVLYEGPDLTEPNARWNTATDPDGQLLCWQGDGNLVIYSSTPSVSTAIWASRTADTEVAGGGEFLVLLQDGTLQIHSATGAVLWTAN